jgi:hypothetical protein
VRLRCQPDHIIWWPVRPIVKTLCESLNLISHCWFCALNVFCVAVLLLFFSYEATQLLDTVLRDAIGTIILDSVPQMIASLAAKWIAQLIISNAAFVVFRALLVSFLYVAYELGRTVIYALLLTFLFLAVASLLVLYLLHPQQVDAFLRAHQILLATCIAMFTISCWYWSRYIHRRSRFHKVFDHDVGAALARFSWR